MHDRVRFRDLTQPFNQKLGQYYSVNRRNGWRAATSVATALLCPGYVEKCYDTVRPGPPFEGGGPLFLVRTNRPDAVVCAEGTVTAYTTTGVPAGYPYRNDTKDLWQRTYVGKFRHLNLPSLASIWTPAGPLDYGSTINRNDLSTLGARAWARLRPKVEVAGLGQAIAEARDVPQMLKTTSKGFHDIWKGLGGSKSPIESWSHHMRTMDPKVLKDIQMHPKKAADHFINHQFGWLPFTKDVSDMYNLITDYTSYLDRAERFNGKWRTRRFAEEELRTEVEVFRSDKLSNQSGFQAYLDPVGITGCKRVQLTVTRETVQKIWYEGSFKTYSPEFDRSLKMEEHLRAGRQFLSLAGANINPSLIYKATPWTWCVDWFVNVGDNIQMLQDAATDAVVARYMYLMREEYDRYRFDSVHTYANETIVGRSYQGPTVKRRVPGAYEFGFTMPPSGLSGMQYAILAALGISRL